MVILKQIILVLFVFMRIMEVLTQIGHIIDEEGAGDYSGLVNIPLVVMEVQLLLAHMVMIIMALLVGVLVMFVFMRITVEHGLR